MRHAAPYSTQAEESLPPRKARHKARWAERPRYFNSLEAANTFAHARAQRLSRRQRITVETGLLGLPVWSVRHLPAPISERRGYRLVEMRAAGNDLMRSLDRMEREA